MKPFIELWSILALLTFYSCSSKENRKETANDIVQQEKVVDTGKNNNAVVVSEPMNGGKENDKNNSHLPVETATSEEIMIALTGDYRKDEKDYLISENGKQWYGVFTNEEAPGQYKIISTVLHIKDTMHEDDAIAPDHIIISTENNKDSWNNCRLLFKGIKVHTTEVQKLYYSHGVKYPGEVLYDINFNGHDYFDLYAQGTVILDTTENPRNYNCNDNLEIGFIVKNYSVFLIKSDYRQNNIRGHRWTGQKYMILPIGAYCSNELPAISFIGDIDGDNIPDFLFEYEYTMGWGISLRLSSQGFKESTGFSESTGC